MFDKVTNLVPSNNCFIWLYTIQKAWNSCHNGWKVSVSTITVPSGPRNHISHTVYLLIHWLYHLLMCYSVHYCTRWENILLTTFALRWDSTSFSAKYPFFIIAWGVRKRDFSFDSSSHSILFIMLLFLALVMRMLGFLL